MQLSNLFSLKGKNAVITGGAGLLGVKHAESIAEMGGIPILIDINERSLQIVSKNIQQKSNIKFKFSIGTMIELPRACLTADQIAKEAEFFSFGTNDLTQTTFGFSRDDIGTFLPDYIEHNIIKEDPFQSLDVKGVGQLVEIGVSKGRMENKKLKIGICGEHGGDPKSVNFFNSIGLDYVSCSPFRVPIAILAAAKSEL